jgi:predicted Zn-dependent protease
VTPELEAEVRAAWARFRQGERTVALARLGALAEAHPDAAQVLGAHAALLWADGQAAPAVRAAEAALALDGEEAGAHSVLARADLRRSRPRQAADHARRAYARSPSAGRAALLARALREAGDLAEASAALEREKGRDAGSAPALRHEEAFVAEARGDRERAEALWQALLEVPAEAAFARGRLMRLRAADMPAAQAGGELLAAARVRAQSDPEAGREILLAAADRLRAGGDFAAAADAYREYLAERPGDAYGLRQLAFTLRRLGRRDEARPLLESLLAREPGDAYVRNALVADYVADGLQAEGEAFVRSVLAARPEAKGLYAAIRRLRAGGERQAREAAAVALRRRRRGAGAEGEAAAADGGGAGEPPPRARRRPRRRDGEGG